VELGAGRSLLHYRLVEKIGEGGMGVIWKATDTSLDREVAIKVLPDAVARDAERLARFEREARLLATLNHPNIASVYGLHDVDGTRFIAMELVPGDDLAQRLVEGAMPAQETIAAGRQIAEALEAAHEAGVVHRDLKPANVKLDAEGRAKVLDFGLAKAFDSSEGPDGNPAESPTVTSAGTLAGTIMGTAAYMSPEQARGTAVDKRADVWAFGALLFEMLAARRPFEGETISDTLAEVLKSTPEWDHLPSTTPASLRAMIRRCLEKDRKRRLRDIGEARILLEDLESGRDPVAAKPETAASAPPRTGYRLRAVALLAVSALLFAAGYFLRTPDAAGPSGIRPDARLRRVTFEPGLEMEPTLSPDGNYLAYSTDDRGNLDIMVLPLAGGSANRVVAGDGDDAQPAWSPDGTRLAFVSARDRSGRLSPVGGLGAGSAYVVARGGDLFVAPAMGGSPIKLAEQGAYPAWSPDGDRLVYQSDRAGHWDIWIIDAEGGDPRALTQDAHADYQPTWSPDGRWIAFVSRRGDSELHVRPADGIETRSDVALVTATLILGPEWSSDGRWLYFTSDRSSTASAMNVWRARFDPTSRTLGTAERVTLSDASDVDVTVGRGDACLAFSTAQFTPNIWELEVASGRLRPITSGHGDEDYAHLSPSGDRLVVQSARGTDSQALWTVNLEGKFLERITHGAHEALTPRWSPDGKQIAYQLNTDNSAKIVVGSPGGASVSPVTEVTSPDAVYSPAWSPDGKQLAWSRSDASATSIWIAEIGGEPRPLVEGEGSVGFPSWSPDGTQVAFQRENEGPRQIFTISPEGGEIRPVTHDAIEYSHPEWSPTDGDSILVVVDHEDLALITVSTGEIRRITAFDQATTMVDYPSWSADGTRIYFSFYRKVGDVYLLEGY
jgi:Tol biopolymer transport system component